MLQSQHCVLGVLGLWAGQLQLYYLDTRSCSHSDTNSPPHHNPHHNTRCRCRCTQESSHTRTPASHSLRLLHRGRWRWSKLWRHCLLTCSLPQGKRSWGKVIMPGSWWLKWLIADWELTLNWQLSSITYVRARRRQQPQSYLNFRIIVKCEWSGESPFSEYARCYVPIWK